MPDELPTKSQILNLAMLGLAKQPGALFLGQSVAYPGWAHDSLSGVPMEQRIEMPVAEELQMGISIGLAIKGFLPVSIYPRMDFLMRAMDALVNHLDKLEAMSRGDFRPKVIIRTRIGPKEPLHAGPQHTQDHCAAFRRMLTNVRLFYVGDKRDIMQAYSDALASDKSVIVVEDLP